jgi:hypothetical protein
MVHPPTKQHISMGDRELTQVKQFFQSDSDTTLVEKYGTYMAQNTMLYTVPYYNGQDYGPFSCRISS